MYLVLQYFLILLDSNELTLLDLMGFIIRRVSEISEIKGLEFCWEKEEEKARKFVYLNLKIVI